MNFFEGLISLNLSLAHLIMTNATNIEGLISIVLIFVASCVHVNRVKALKPILSTDLKLMGPLSIFHKASVVGIRLKWPISIFCAILAFYILIR